MKNLGQRYVQHVNRTCRRTGTLWEGRFRSCLARSERYVLACCRNIELNAVRAATVTHPRQYRWSSYRANAEGGNDDLIAPHEQYRRPGGSDEARRHAYRRRAGGSRRTIVMDCPGNMLTPRRRVGGTGKRGLSPISLLFLFTIDAEGGERARCTHIGWPHMSHCGDP